MRVKLPSQKKNVRAVQYHFSRTKRGLGAWDVDTHDPEIFPENLGVDKRIRLPYNISEASASVTLGKEGLCTWSI